MSSISIQQMADRVAALMEERLGARGTGLEAKLKSRGRALPRKVRQAASDLARSAAMAQNPKLLLQIDHDTLARNYDICLRHLTGLKPRTGWRDHVLGLAASVVGTLVLVSLLVLVFLRWRGLV